MMVMGLRLDISPEGSDPARQALEAFAVAFPPA